MMRWGWIGLAAVAIFALPAAGEHVAELDLDGVIGNGPDTIDIEPGALFEVDAWITEGCGLNSIGLVFCNEDGYLDFVDAEYNYLSSWTHNPPDTMYVSGCVRMVATDWTAGCVGFFPPRRFATLTYLTADESAVSHLEIDGENSGWFGPCFCDPPYTGYFENTTGAVIRIGSTETRTDSWGSIKTLFR